MCQLQSHRCLLLRWAHFGGLQARDLVFLPGWATHLSSPSSGPRSPLAVPKRPRSGPRGCWSRGGGLDVDRKHTKTSKSDLKTLEISRFRSKSHDFPRHLDERRVKRGVHRRFKLYIVRRARPLQGKARGYKMLVETFADMSCASAADGWLSKHLRCFQTLYRASRRFGASCPSDFHGFPMVLHGFSIFLVVFYWYLLVFYGCSIDFHMAFQGCTARSSCPARAPCSPCSAATGRGPSLPRRSSGASRSAAWTWAPSRRTA